MLKHLAAFAVAASILFTVLPAQATPKFTQALFTRHRYHRHITIQVHRKHQPFQRLINTGYRFRFTGYTAGDPAQGTGYHTAIGTRADYGSCAVDPRIIPLGTKLYIPGYGQCMASDTGGAVGGYHIDLCYGVGRRGSAAYYRATHNGLHFGAVYIVR